MVITLRVFGVIHSYLVCVDFIRDVLRKNQIFDETIFFAMKISFFPWDFFFDSVSKSSKIAFEFSENPKVVTFRGVCPGYTRKKKPLIAMLKNSAGDF